ncbi:MAG: efflux RND transporter periplasmic adaptor subunit [Proteobacteria bacterium]|nr:efflux RND transporter periplasmic adaptor subunit [Pseudomonadota bacterium]MBU1715672.1 efflux RND transporter periplasmic adaptor subunit [Pseudomonadota bacterium]
MKKFIYFIAIALGLLVLFLIVKKPADKTGDQRGPTSCQTITVEPGEIATVITGRDKLTTKRFSQIRTSGNKKIKKVLVKEGELVEKDQCLALVETDDQYDLELHNARWGLITNEQKLTELTSRLQDQEKLYAEGFIALLAIKETKSQLAQLETQKNILEKKINLYENKLGQTAGESPDLNVKADSGDICVKAPFAGTVMQIFKHEGDIPTPAAEQNFPEPNAGTIMILADLSEYFVEYKVSEIDLAKIEKGQAVSLIFDSFPTKTYRGVVDHISDISSVTRKDQMQEQRDLSYYLVKIKVIDSGPELKQGLSCRVSIEIEHKKGVLLAPVRALIKEDDGEYVFTLAGGLITKKQITTGLLNENMFEITSGLTAGDQICVDPFIVMEQEALRKQKADRNWLEKIFN